MEDERSWDWPSGHELAPGLLAWALLGEGPRCQTWLAWDVERWSPVAVKLPGPASLGSTRAEAGLRREAELTAGLAHPGIRRLLDARLDEPLPLLVFEYVEGPTLDDALATDGRFEAVDVVLVGLQLGAALAYLHGRGLVHLDLKPGNAVLRDDRPVLLDLGLSLPAGTPPAGARVRGSPPWMAPEHARLAPAAPGMDLFALGAVLYELATGVPAFDPVDDGPLPARYPQLAGRPVPAGELVPDLPSGLEAAIDALLASDPADRPADARAALAVLAAALPAGAEAERPWPAWASARLARQPAAG
jgi:eukaryotic-like serine/threonine-protein kinase